MSEGGGGQCKKSGTEFITSDKKETICKICVVTNYPLKYEIENAFNLPYGNWLMTMSHDVINYRFIHNNLSDLTP